MSPILTWHPRDRLWRTKIAGGSGDAGDGSIGGRGNGGGISDWGNPCMAGMICWMTVRQLKSEGGYGTHRNKLMQFGVSTGDTFSPFCHMMWTRLYYRFSAEILLFSCSSCSICSICPWRGRFPEEERFICNHIYILGHWYERHSSCIVRVHKNTIYTYEP